MKIHLVSGFLGSGKTTAIAGIAKILIKKGITVGVVTNDQGKYLVDSEFMHADSIPAVDVQGGCFCSDLPRLDEQITHLVQNVDPDVIFLESIGSSGNLVGTVMEPLPETSGYTAASLTAFSDARLLIRYLRQQPLPFSETICALFETQIMEAQYLVINKIDLLSESDLNFVRTSVLSKFPDKVHLFISALKNKNLDLWFDEIERSAENKLTARPHPLDVRIKKNAFARLKWYETQRQFNSPESFVNYLNKIFDLVRKNGWIIAHIKCHINDSNGRHRKLSFTELPDFLTTGQINDLRGNLRMVLNARIEAPRQLERYLDSL